MHSRIGKETDTCNEAYLYMDPARGEMNERGRDTNRVTAREMGIVDLSQGNATALVEVNYVRILRLGSRVTLENPLSVTIHSKLVLEKKKDA